MRGPGHRPAGSQTKPLSSQISPFLCPWPGLYLLADAHTLAGDVDFTGLATEIATEVRPAR